MLEDWRCYSRKNKYCCIKKGFKNRTVDKGTGIDKKHNSYSRYLARKTGWFYDNNYVNFFI